VKVRFLKCARHACSISQGELAGLCCSGRRSSQEAHEARTRFSLQGPEWAATTRDRPPPRGAQRTHSNHSTPRGVGFLVSTDLPDPLVESQSPAAATSTLGVKPRGRLGFEGRVPRHRDKLRCDVFFFGFGFADNVKGMWVWLEDWNSKRFAEGSTARERG